jgi:Mor family transcriptional regulator
MYKCYACKKQFTEGIRLIPATIWIEYTKGKQTYEQLSKKYKCSKRTIQRKLDLHDVIIHKKTPNKVVVLMDTVLTPIKQE